jgi:oligosaccharide repeat unit polymerase
MPIIGLTLYTIGFVAMIWFVISSGGISYVLTHTQTNYAAGRSYLWNLNQLMVLGMLCMWGTARKPNPLVLIGGFGLYSLIMIIFTKRAPILETLLLLMMTRNYRAKRYRVSDFLRPRRLAVGLLIALLIVALPSLRNPSGFYTYSSLSEALRQTWNKIGAVFREYSFVSRDAFVYANYNISNMYYGRTLLNLITAPLPSRVFSWKPPVDDGVYLANFMRGDYVSPPSKNLPFLSSVPFSSQGSLYANFGVVGMVVGSILMGIMYEHFYKMVKDTGSHIFAILVYYVIIHKFAFSSKNVTQSLAMLIPAVLVFKALAALKLTRVKVKGPMKHDRNFA